MRVAFLSACLLGVLVGCSDDSVTVDTTASNYCAEIAEVYCHNMYQCCTEHEIESRLGVSEPRTELECRDDLAKSCERQTAPIADSIAAGRVTFNANIMNTCLNAIVAPEGVCATVQAEAPWKDACKDVAFIGTVAVGGMCFYDVDCAGSPKTAECAPSQKCVALPVAGFPCVNGGCAADFFCGTTGICQAKSAEGAPCTAANQCQDNLFCDFTAPTPVCTSQQGGGAACTNDVQCISGECVPGMCKGSTFQTCYTDLTCQARCANSTVGCTVGQDWYCNMTTPGHCDLVTTTPCSGSTADQTCINASAGTKCIFNVACVPGDCIGDPVCTAPLSLVDYCTATTIDVTP